MRETPLYHLQLQRHLEHPRAARTTQQRLQMHVQPASHAHSTLPCLLASSETQTHPNTLSPCHSRIEAPNAEPSARKPPELSVRRDDSPTHRRHQERRQARSGSACLQMTHVRFQRRARDASRRSLAQLDSAICVSVVLALAAIAQRPDSGTNLPTGTFQPRRCSAFASVRSSGRSPASPERSPSQRDLHGQKQDTHLADLDWIAKRRPCPVRF